MHKDQLDRLMTAIEAELYPVDVPPSIRKIIASHIADAIVLNLPDWINSSTKLELKHRIIEEIL